MHIFALDAVFYVARHCTFISEALQSKKKTSLTTSGCERIASVKWTRCGACRVGLAEGAPQYGNERTRSVCSNLYLRWTLIASEVVWGWCVGLMVVELNLFRWQFATSWATERVRFADCWSKLRGFAESFWLMRARLCAAAIYRFILISVRFLFIVCS